MTADFYVEGDGWLHRVDPRVKFFISLALIVLALVWGNVLFLACLLLLEHIMLLSDKINVHAFGRVWKVVAPIALAVFIVLLLCLRTGNQLLWDWHWWRVSVQSLTLSGSIALRIAVIIFALFITLYTTTQAQLISGVTGLHLPYTMGLRVARVARFLPVYFNTVHEIVLAQSLQGMSTGSEIRRNRLAKFAHWYRSRVEASASALPRMRRLERNLQWAMQTRGLNIDRGSAPRTSYTNVHMRVIDWLIVLVSFAITVGVIVCKSMGYIA